MSGSSTNELLRAALNGGGRVPSSGGRSSKRASRRATPKSGRSRDVSDDEQGGGADDCASVASDDTWEINGAEEEEGEGVDADAWEDALAAALDAAGERRAAARERGLAQAANILAHVFVGERLAGRGLASLDVLKRSARGARSETEGLLALRGVALWFVAFGVDAPPAEYAAAAAMLRELARDHASPHVRVMALRALGVASFVAGGDSADAADVMQFVAEQLAVSSAPGEPPSDAIVGQALETYGLLMTVVAEARPREAERLFDSVFDIHLRALAADCVEVRVAAAQNFALVHAELSRSQGRSFEFDRQEELLATLLAVRQQSIKRLGKRDTHTQRLAIRRVLQSIESGAAPELRLAFHGRYVTFSDWPRIIRLYAFRSTLGGGINAHFADNPLLQQVFNVEFDSAANDYANNEARQVVSPSSSLAKARSVDMRKRREARNSARRFQDGAADLSD
ncbi:Interferon- developmental regulator 1 [Coemansia sp. RSA 2320]|nr:Interferon- developmental regulator 1 [Coemansia sp. RSA 2320]